MAGMRYYSYPGMGEKALQAFGYNQAVRVGNRIECAGQLGWNINTGEVPKNLSDEIDQIFANVDHNLKHAGGKGWTQVFRVRSYHTNMGSQDWYEPMLRNLKKWMPDHQPIWTAVGVTRLGMDEWHTEIEVVALDQEGAEAARVA